jgi:hypothetical protein
MLVATDSPCVRVDSGSPAGSSTQRCCHLVCTGFYSEGAHWVYIDNITLPVQWPSTHLSKGIRHPRVYKVKFITIWVQSLIHQSFYNRKINKDNGSELLTRQGQHLVVRCHPLKRPQARREKGPTCTRLDNKAKPKQLILIKTYSLMWP